MSTIAYLQLRQMLGERKVLGLALFLALPVGLSFILRIKGGNEVFSAPEPTAIYLFVLYPQVLCELTALLYASTILSTELDGQTLIYLFTRPIPKWQVIVGKYLGMVAGLAVPMLISLVCSWCMIGAPHGARLIGSIGVATVASLLAYGAVFVAVGVVIPARAMVVGLIYGLFEFSLSFVPALLNEVTVTYHLRSIVVRTINVEMPPEFRRALGGASLWGSALALVIMVVAGLVVASFAVSAQQYIPAKNE